MRTALLLLLAGCGDSGLAQVSEEVACTDFAKALCSQLMSCGAPLIKITYGDQATCEARLKAPCKSALKDPGTTQTPNRIDACARALTAASCTDLFNHVTPADCKPLAGALADGSVCGDDGQCKSAYCKKTNAICGVCSNRNGTCLRDDDCDSGLVCGGTTCVMRGSMGATCDDTHPCGYGLTCSGGTCSTPPGAGMACMADQNGGNCNTAQGYFCNPFSNVCQAFGYANAGEPCGLVNQSFVLCTANGRCTGMLMGNCMAAAADGAACSVANGPNCQAPSQCINSLCTLSDTSTCK